VTFEGDSQNNLFMKLMTTFILKFLFSIFFHTFPLHFYKFWFGISFPQLRQTEIYGFLAFKILLFILTSNLTCNVFGSLQPNYGPEFWIKILPYSFDYAQLFLFSF
jgi:hypothetical protein